ncbi:MAG TPA: septum site-determining protein MinC [Rhodocyclaceae bacterium]|nr:septum site-determining protein MinC [Rhodocyclaceae bacterium]
MSAHSLIELKGAMLPVLSVILRSLDLGALKQEALDKFGEEAFFDGELAALDLSATDYDAPAPDWIALCQLFAHYGLRVVGIRGGSPELVASAEKAGLPPLSITDTPHRAAPPRPAPEPAPAPTPAPVAEKPAEPAPTAPPPPPPPANTLIIDRPLRSGQRVYARGGDVIVLAVVSTGAEVIADGSIHVYAPLRGRALAGASGDTKARILTTRMEAELVSIAGLYRTFEDGVPAQLAGQPTQVRLMEEGEKLKLVVEPLSIG